MNSDFISLKFVTTTKRKDMLQKSLIDELVGEVQNVIENVAPYHSMSEADLNFKSKPDSWSILECLEHLNLYGDFYLVEVEKRILEATTGSFENQAFKPGWLGNYFAQSMLPPEDGSKMKTMTTFKDKDPKSSTLPKGTLERFIKQQKRWLQLLEECRSVDLNKVKTNITILKGIIRLKLGDTLRFVMYHNKRHLIQAHKVKSVIDGVK